MSTVPGTSSPSRVTSIVVEALELEGAERAAFLDRACGGDSALRAEVESLLAETGSTEFLEVPAAEHLAGPVPDPPTPVPPTRVGPYRIVRRLGEGGMGTVYLAEQDEPIRRRVALKVIRKLAQPRSRERFTAECQALARLNHPNVASLYEVGTVTDVSVVGGEHPYVAMEWIEGEHIVTWCDARQADLETRLRLFLGVCAGIGHAHGQGVLHCDLKPSNILVTDVDGEAVAKVIDFGIARALDEPLVGGETTFTKESFLGSPVYASPEVGIHGRRQLDGRSDVYSLGLILFELLVGALPFDVEDQGVWMLLRQLVDRQPVAPTARLASLDPEAVRASAAARSTTSKGLGRELRGDLDAILLRATAPAPEDRYGSAADLAADLERHLQREPVAARGDAALYRLGRLAQRHLVSLILVGLLLAALVGGLIARTAEARRANAEAERARQALAESEEIRRFMIELFEAADPEPAATERLTVRELLDRGAERLREELEDQPLARARFLQTIGTIYTKLGLFPAAEELTVEALELRESNLAVGHPEVLESRSELGVLLRRAGRLEESQELLEGVLRARRIGDTDPELVAQAHSHLGNLYWNQERFEDAEEAHRAALEIRASDPESRVPEGMSANNLGVLLMSQGRPAEARPYLLRAAELLASELGEHNARVASPLNNLGLVDRDLATWAEAEARFREAGAIYEAAYGPGHRRTLRARRNLAGEFLRKHRWQEAVAEARAVAELLEGDGDPVEQVRALRFQGDAERRAKLHDEAIATLESTLRLAEEALGAEHPELAAVRTTLALALSDAGQAGRAVELLDVLAELQDRTLDLDHRSRVRTTDALGYVALAAGRLDAAEVHYRRVLESRRRIFGEHSRWTARAYYRLGQVLAGRAQDRQAVQAFTTALALLRSQLGTDHPWVGDSAHELALLERRLGRMERARELLEQAITVRRAHYLPDDPDLEASVEALASLRRHSGFVE